MKKSIFFKWVVMLILMIGGNIFTSKVTYAIVDLQIPSATGSYIYNGENQSLELSNFDESLINVTGNVGISAGNYKAILSLINPSEYRWSDGTTDDVIIDWEIEKASTTMEVKMENFYYGNKKPQPQIIGNTEKAPIKYYYTTTNANTGGTLWANVQNSTTLDLGTYYMYAVVEESENYYAVTTEPDEFTISKFAIDVNLKTDGFDYNGEWTNKNVQAIIEIPVSMDEVTYIYYKTEDMANFEAHQNTTTIGNILTITFDNPIEKDVTFVGVNVAGRAITIETTKKIKIEKEKPKIESVIEEVTENTIKVKATATDAESGIKYYTTTNGEIPSTWIELPNAMTITEINIEAPTNMVTYLWVMDEAGNKVAEGEEILQYKDCMSPEGTIKVIGNEIDGSVYVNNRDVTLEITAKDDTTVSGDLKMKIYEAEEFINLETTENITWDSFKEVVKYNLSEGDGKKTLYLLLRDEAGNISVVIPDNSPERADYKVHYYLENTDNENYTEYKVETKSGMKGSKIEFANLKKRIEGATYVKTTLTPNGAEVEEATINADGSTNVYLYYDRNEYTLALVKNEYVTSVTGAGTYKYGKAIDISATPLNEIGYTYKFLNWSSNNKEALKDIATPDATIIMPASAITLTAKATKETNEYTVTFDANGGLIDGAGTETITQKIIFGKAYGDIPEATKGGNKFLGWYNETDNQVTAETIMNIAQNHTIKAKWEKVNTLTVNPNGAIWSDTSTCEIRKYIGKAGESLIIPMLLPKAGTISIIFDGNGGKVNGQETYTLTKEYDTVQRYLTGDSKGTYNANTNEYIFADGNATITTIHSAYFANADCPTPQKVGYIFTGWNTKADGTGAQIYLNDYFIQSYTLYAQWQAKQYYVTYDSNEGNLVGTSPIGVKYDSPYGTMPTATRDGYEFAGWYTEKNGGSRVTSTSIVKTESDHTLYAHWNLLTYNIEYNLNGGTVATVNPTQYNTESAPITLNNPTKTGYTFAGWTGTGLTGATNTVTIPTGSYGDRSYTATWIANKYDVTYNPNGGTLVGVSPVEVTFDSPYGTMPSATRTGYSFLGWYTLASGGSKVETTTIVTRNEGHTLYAQWKDVENPKVEVSDITYPANAIIKLTDSESGIRYWGITNSQAEPTSTGTTNTLTGNTLNYWYPMDNTITETQVTFTGLNAGDYYAWGKDLTGNQTSVAFTVNKATISPTVTMSGYTYGGTKSEPSVNGNTGNGTVTYYYNTSNTNSGGTLWSTVTSSTSLPVGTYYMYAVVGETRNYKGATTPAVSFTITYPQYTVTLNPNGGSVSPTSITVTYAGTYSGLPTPTYTGYSFLGWFTAASGGTQITTTTTVDGSANGQTLYAQWQIANTAPNTPTVTFNSKTTSSFKVNAEAIDLDGNNLTYRLYVGDTLKDTSNATASGTQVTLEATGLSDYTDYDYYVTVSDESLTSTSNTLNVRTYCPGTGITCSLGVYCNENSYGVVKCPECDGKGIVICMTANKVVGESDNCGARHMTCAVCDNRDTLNSGNRYLHAHYLCEKCGATDCFGFCSSSCRTEWVKGNSMYQHYVSCSACDNGYVNGLTGTCGTHGGTTGHYWCSEHSYNCGNTNSHSYCSHSRTSQHDD